MGETTEGMVLGQLWLTGWAVCTSVCTTMDVLTSSLQKKRKQRKKKKTLTILSRSETKGETDKGTSYCLSLKNLNNNGKAGFIISSASFLNCSATSVLSEIPINATPYAERTTPSEVLNVATSSFFLSLVSVSSGSITATGASTRRT